MLRFLPGARCAHTRLLVIHRRALPSQHHPTQRAPRPAPSALNLDHRPCRCEDEEGALCEHTLPCQIECSRFLHKQTKSMIGWEGGFERVLCQRTLKAAVLDLPHQGASRPLFPWTSMCVSSCVGRSRFRLKTPAGQSFPSPPLRSDRASKSSHMIPADIFLTLESCDVGTKTRAFPPRVQYMSSPPRLF